MTRIKVGSRAREGGSNNGREHAATAMDAWTDSQTHLIDATEWSSGHHSDSELKNNIAWCFEKFRIVL